MKKYWFLILLSIGFSLFAQEDKDIKEIIRLSIELNDDTEIPLYKKFKNNRLLTIFKKSNSDSLTRH